MLVAKKTTAVSVADASPTWDTSASIAAPFAPSASSVPQHQKFSVPFIGHTSNYRFTWHICRKGCNPKPDCDRHMQSHVKTQQEAEAEKTENQLDATFILDVIKFTDSGKFDSDSAQFHLKWLRICPIPKRLVPTRTSRARPARGSSRPAPATLDVTTLKRLRVSRNKVPSDQRRTLIRCSQKLGRLAEASLLLTFRVSG